MRPYRLLPLPFLGRPVLGWPILSWSVLSWSVVGCLALLTACGEEPWGAHGPSGQLQNVEVSGTVLFPGQAGTATLTSSGVETELFSGTGPVPNREPLKVITAEVAADGSYLLTLPPALPVLVRAPAHLPVSLPAALWQSDTPLSCQGRPVLDDPAAQLLVVDGGFYSVGGKRTGDLLPQSLGLADDRGTVTTLKLLVYADRSATVRGTLKCSSEGQGSALAARVTLDYRFRRGWNTVVVRSERPAQSGTLDIQGQVSPPQGPIWKFLPTPH